MKVLQFLLEATGIMLAFFLMVFVVVAIYEVLVKFNLAERLIDRIMKRFAIAKNEDSDPSDLSADDLKKFYQLIKNDIQEYTNVLSAERDKAHKIVTAFEEFYNDIKENKGYFGDNLKNVNKEYMLNNDGDDEPDDTPTSPDYTAIHKARDDFNRKALHEEVDWAKKWDEWRTDMAANPTGDDDDTDIIHEVCEDCDFTDEFWEAARDADPDEGGDSDDDSGTDSEG